MRPSGVLYSELLDGLPADMEVAGSVECCKVINIEHSISC